MLNIFTQRKNVNILLTYIVLKMIIIIIVAKVLFVYSMLFVKEDMGDI